MLLASLLGPVRQSFGPLRGHFARCGLILLIGVLLAGCSAVSYGVQAVAGHGRILNDRQPVQDVIDNPQTPPQVRSRLVLAQQVIAFGEARGLRTGRNYRHYSRTDPDAVVYNVFATPEFSLSPLTNCFPVIGCVAYRGFYDPQEASAYRDKLVEQGKDTALFPIGAYSTLGFTPDPLTTAIIARSELSLIKTLLHESVHSTVFLGGDTAFDEGLAEAIARELSAQFIAQQALEPGADAVSSAEILADFEAGDRAELLVNQSVNEFKLMLANIYADPFMSDEEKRAAKAQVFQQMRSWQREQRDALYPYTYDRMFAGEMNNAHLMAFGLYDDLTGDLQQIFVQRFGRDVSAMVAWARGLKSATPSQRRQEIARLLNE